MSAATIPFQLRHGFFPSCTVISDGGGGTYVALNQTDSDNGLREAMRIFYLSQRVTVVPAGTLTVTSGAGTETDSFSETFRFPDLINPAQGDGVDGAIVASRVNWNTTVEPAFRVCSPLNDFVCRYTQDYNELAPFPKTEQRGSFRAFISFQGGEWRLYFRFIFSLGIERAAYFGRLFIDSQNVMGTASAGNITFFGYSLPYYVYTTVSNPISVTATASGVSLTTTTEEWSF